MNRKALTTALAVAGIAVAAQATAQVTLFDRDGFRGRSIDIDRPIGNMERFGFNDRAASAIVDNGNWEVCEDARFDGRCVVLQPGRYRDLASMGLKYQISSIRPVDYNTADSRPHGRAGVVQQDYYRRGPNEDVYTADVTSVRAVMGAPGQRCWVEQQQVTERRGGGDNGAQIGGAIAGAVIGGILGHQIGGGRGQDVATAAGAVGGAVAGSNLAGRNSGGERDVVSTRDVQRCSTVPNDRPAYYDVTYYFRGHEHHVQMSTPPGPTIAVNADGDPRM